MIGTLITPAEKASMKAVAIREIQREAAERRAELERQYAAKDAERLLFVAAQTECFKEAFNESAAKLAEEIGIEPGQVASVLASIVAGQVPNFRCTFDDEL